MKAKNSICLATHNPAKEPEVVPCPPADPAAQVLRDAGIQPLPCGPLITRQRDAQRPDTCGVCREGHACSGLNTCDGRQEAQRAKPCHLASCHHSCGGPAVQSQAVVQDAACILKRGCMDSGVVCLLMDGRSGASLGSLSWWYSPWLACSLTPVERGWRASTYSNGERGL